jgi:hypothetical protein
LTVHAVHLPEKFTLRQVSPSIVTQVNPVITVSANANSHSDAMASFIAGVVVGLALAYAMDEATEHHHGPRK